MKWTVQRYVLREVVQTWLAVTGILVAILVSNQLSRVLGQAADNDYGRHVVFDLIALGAIMNLSVIVPVGLLLAIVLALGRLYHDSEMAALQACGFAPVRAARCRCPASPLVIAVGLAWLVVLPGAARRPAGAAAAPIGGQRGAVRAARCRPLPLLHERRRRCGVLCRAGRCGGACCTTCSCAARRPGGIEVALADTATYSKAARGRHAFRDPVQRPALRGSAGTQRFSRDRVPRARHPHRDAGRGASARTQDPDTKPTRELIGSSAPSDIAQLQFRASSPIMALVLTLVAVPLSRLRPRQGRYARVGFAIVVYFVYSNLLSACQGLGREGRSAARDRRLVGAHSRSWRSACISCSARDEEHVNTLDRYLYRTVMLYTAMAMAVLLTLGRAVRVHQPAERHRRRQLRHGAMRFCTRF